MRSRDRGAFALALTALVAACGIDESGARSDAAGSANEPVESQTSLTVSLRNYPQTAPTVWQLQCDPLGGTHPRPATACATLAQTPDAFEPVPGDVMCSQIYSGPERATITGQWQGHAVHATYWRTDSCQTERWQRIVEVLQPGQASSPNGS